MFILQLGNRIIKVKAGWHCKLPNIFHATAVHDNHQDVYKVHKFSDEIICIFGNQRLCMLYIAMPFMLPYSTNAG
jgi:hypothetical protein